MSVPNFRFLEGLTSLEEVQGALSQLRRILDFYFQGRISSVNILVGGIKSKNLDIEDLITAIRGEFDTLISNVTITYSLAAEKGYIAELTVDQLETSDKVQKYLMGDTSDVNYIKVYDQYIQFITATTDGTEVEQATDRFGNLLYWKDDTYTGVTLEVTPYPVMIYKYNELVKMEFSFQPDESGTMNPRIVLGSGAGYGDPNKGKGFIYKDVDGILIEYVKQNGEKVSLRLGENGLIMTPYGLQRLDIYTDGFSANYSGYSLAYRWTKDTEGKITSLIDINTGQTIPVNWYNNPI